MRVLDDLVFYRACVFFSVFQWLVCWFLGTAVVALIWISARFYFSSWCRWTLVSSFRSIFCGGSWLRLSAVEQSHLASQVARFSSPISCLGRTQDFPAVRFAARELAPARARSRSSAGPRVLVFCRPVAFGPKGLIFFTGPRPVFRSVVSGARRLPVFLFGGRFSADKVFLFLVFVVSGGNI
jgi:hypothetical protein